MDHDREPTTLGSPPGPPRPAPPRVGEASYDRELVVIRLAVTVIGGLLVLLSVFSLPFLSLHTGSVDRSLDLGDIAGRIDGGQDFGDMLAVYALYIRPVMPVFVLAVLVTTPGFPGVRPSRSYGGVIAVVTFAALATQAPAMFLVTDRRYATALIASEVTRDLGAWVGLIGHGCLLAAQWIDPRVTGRPAPRSRR